MTQLNASTGLRHQTTVIIDKIYFTGGGQAVGSLPKGMERISTFRHAMYHSFSTNRSCMRQRSCPVKRETSRVYDFPAVLTPRVNVDDSMTVILRVYRK